MEVITSLFASSIKSVNREIPHRQERNNLIIYNQKN